MLAACLTSAHAQKRVALVIGNSTYQRVGVLPNPANDAVAMATLLKAAGFTIHMSRDLANADLRRAVGDFAESARDADMAVVFFAGHGMEVDGTNYLIPIDATLARDYDVEDEALSLDRVLKAIEPARRLRFVILDACRDNPFVKTMKRTASRSIGRGFARVEPTASDTLVAFATEAGSVAADGDGANSPFTAALLKHLATPGLDLRLAFGRVRDEVVKATSNRQRPFVYGSLGGSTVAIVDAPPAAQPQSEAVQRVVDPCAAAEVHWKSAEALGSKAAFEDHLSRFRGCTFAGLAAARIAALERGRIDDEERRKRAQADARRPQEERDHPAAEVQKKAEEERKRVVVVSPPVRPLTPNHLDGVWTVTRSLTAECGAKGSVFTIRVEGSVVRGPGGTGSISSSGSFRVAGHANVFNGTLHGNSGSGTYSGKCAGTFSARRN